ncbi:MAG: mechanosensitive ion channel family protein [Dehalococcoidia bacterium]
MPEELATTWYWILGIVLGMAGSYLVVRLLLRPGVTRLQRWLEASPQLQPLAGVWLALGRLVELFLLALLVLGSVLGILRVLNRDVTPALDALEGMGVAVLGWLVTHGVRILLIAVIAFILIRLLRRVVPGYLERGILRGLARGSDQYEEAQKRASTLTGVITGTLTVLIVVVALFMVLAELRLNIGPVLAGVGIAGIALGFGAQHLVRDLISGVLILLEDQYRKGDVAAVGGKIGLVEDVNLRRTLLRDLDGIVHIIPNGEITTASNYTKGFSRVNLNISVAYKEDLDKVFAVIDRVGEELAQDPYYGPLITQPPKALRVDAFEDSGIAIKVLGETRPIRQWEVMGELRLRLKKAFDQEGIEIPFPHITLYWGVGASPFADQVPLASSAPKSEPVRSEPEPELTERLPDSDEEP